MSLVETNFDEEATVERYIGQSGYEDEYEDPETIKCEIQHEKSWSRDANGDVVVSSLTLKVSPDLDPIPTQSKITVDGEEHKVLDTRTPRDRLIGGKHHMEIDLT